MTTTRLTTPDKIVAAFIARVQETGDVPRSAMWVADIVEDQMIDLGADPDDAMDAKVTALTHIIHEMARLTALVRTLGREVAR